MPLIEWKAKLKVLKAMNRLESGDSVEVIALKLGYFCSSVFIVMFKRIMRVTFKEYVTLNVQCFAQYFATSSQGLST